MMRWDGVDDKMLFLLVIVVVMQWVMLACWVGLIVAIELFLRHKIIFYSANTINLHKLVYFMLSWREILTLEDLYYGNAVRMIGSSIDVFFKHFVTKIWYIGIISLIPPFADEIEGTVSAMIHLNIGNLEKPVIINRRDCFNPEDDTKSQCRTLEVFKNAPLGRSVLCHPVTTSGAPQSNNNATKKRQERRCMKTWCSRSGTKHVAIRQNKLNRLWNVDLQTWLKKSHELGCPQVNEKWVPLNQKSKLNH
jgi:hypothetical protein